MAISKLGYHFSNRGNHQSGDKYIVDTTLNATTAKIDEIIDILNNLEVEDFTTQVIFNEPDRGGYMQFKKIGNIVIIIYQGESKTHTPNEVLFTIPKKYAPKSVAVAVPFTEYHNAYGQVRITPEGAAEIMNISSTSASGRIIFEIVYVI